MGRRERNYAEVEKRLCDSGRQLVVENGLSAVTVEMITERADVAVATFYSHFDSTEVFWTALGDAADSWVLKMVQALASLDQPAHVKLAMGIRTAVDRAAEVPIDFLFMLIRNTTVGEEFGKFDGYMTATISDGVRAGLFPAVRDPELAAVMYRNAMQAAVNAQIRESQTLMWKDIVYLGLQLLGTGRADITDAVSAVATAEWKPRAAELS